MTDIVTNSDISGQKIKKGMTRVMPFFRLIPSPRYLPKNYSYCNAIYDPAVVLGGVPIFAQPAKVSATFKTVVDALKRTTASGLEQ